MTAHELRLAAGEVASHVDATGSKYANIKAQGGNVHQLSEERLGDEGKLVGTNSDGDNQEEKSERPRRVKRPGALEAQHKNFGWKEMGKQ